MSDIYKQYITFADSFFDKAVKNIEDLFVSRAGVMEKTSQNIIIKNDRIDTGLMLNTVRGITDFTEDIKGISLISDQEQKGRFYSSYQEYGTSKIKGIHFVENSFKDNTRNILEEIEKAIERAGNE